MYQELLDLKNEKLQELLELEADLNAAKSEISKEKEEKFKDVLKDYEIYTDSSCLSTINVEESDKNYYYYKILSNVQIHEVSINVIPPSEDYPPNEPWYLYGIKASIEKLKFNITYHSNKHIKQNSTDSTENIQNLNVTLDKSFLQKDVQNGLDFFSNHPTYISSLILFLKQINKLTSIRRNICLLLTDKYPDFVQTGVDKETGYCVIVYKGFNGTLMIHWRIKFVPKKLSVRDSFKIETSITDENLVENVNKSLQNIINPTIWLNSTIDDKIKHFSSVFDLIQLTNISKQLGNDSST